MLVSETFSFDQMNAYKKIIQFSMPTNPLKHAHQPKKIIYLHTQKFHFEKPNKMFDALHS